MAARLRAPGWYRALLAIPLGFALAAGIDIGVRALYGWHPIVDWTAIVTVSLIAMPLAFLVGIGCFDYWFRWAAGAPTVPEDHSEHLQRAVLGARVADDLPVHHPGLRRDRELRPAADDRRAGHGVPAPERAVVLDAADGGSALHHQLPGPRRC